MQGGPIQARNPSHRIRTGYPSQSDQEGTEGAERRKSPSTTDTLRGEGEEGEDNTNGEGEQNSRTELENAADDQR